MALQLVMDGLKLQPCDPTILDERDAILLADQNDSGGVNQCLILEGLRQAGNGRQR